ncbi:Whey acidic protein [Trichinella spiralis]|uniref:Whey acidic protein n=1 Tax=Trichinella spiralis TaxID=6334 RepID=A0A0V1AZ92_TRISP|nr:Whey acidic protein [Trichinella spiralis]
MQKVAFVMLLLVVESLRTLSKNSHQKERNVNFRDVVKKKGKSDDLKQLPKIQMRQQPPLLGTLPQPPAAINEFSGIDKQIINCQHCTQTGCPQGYYCYYDLCCQHTKPGSCPWQIAGNNPVAGPPCDTDIDCAYNLKCCTINQRSRCTFPYGYSGGTVGQVPPQPVPTSFAPAMPVSVGVPVMAGMPFDMYGGGGGGFLDYPDMYGGYGGGFGYDAVSDQSIVFSASAWKAGTCPGLPVPIDPDVQYTDRCWNDEDCSGDRKCCMSVVGKACMLPVETSDELRPGGCPGFFDYGGIKTHHCQRDTDCSQPRKCCDTAKGKRCLLPNEVISNQQKPGTCPTFYGIPDEDSFDRCKADFECPGSRKCCTTRSGKFCLLVDENSSEQIKPGFCPPVYGIISPRAFNRCNNDADCTSNKKCCDTVSGRACMAPSGNKFEEETKPIIIIKPGKCPRFYGAQESQLFDRCIRDSDCNGNRKCCATRTGKECLLPNYDNESDDMSDNNNSNINNNNNNIRPGVCPPYFGAVNVIKNMCAVDSDCKMPRKCCQTITGKMCLLLS